MKRIRLFDEVKVTTLDGARAEVVEIGVMRGVRGCVYWCRLIASGETVPAHAKHLCRVESSDASPR